MLNLLFCRRMYHGYVVGIGESSPNIEFQRVPRV
jgi:hypothetical protein